MKYIALSGGADSTALALLFWERGEEFELVFSDTGAELPETYWIIPRVARHVGKPLHIVNNGTFYQHLVSVEFMLPGPRMRWCTRLLKQVPQDRFFNKPDTESVAMGIRADEAHRANLKPRGKVSYEFTYPLVEAGLAKQDVITLCEKYDLLSPVYKWRSNTSCFCCFFQKKSDWLELLKHHPDLYALAEDWEEQRMSHAKVSAWGWNERWTLRQLRGAAEAQLRLWPEPEEEPCIICAV